MINSDLRLKIVHLIANAKEGHIPSSFSVVDIINFVFEKQLNINKRNINSSKRDYFILSKGHSAAALYVVLNKFKILKDKHLLGYGKSKGILGGHPETTKTPGVEASTGSLGHGFPYAVGIALGLKLSKKKNKVITLIGDGECHEGTIWEAANIAVNQNLNNLTVIVDRNESAIQLMKIENLEKKWKAFGWDVIVADGHSKKSLVKAFKKIKFSSKPKIIIADTVKGKGVSFLEGHGAWHHKIPNKEELKLIEKELGKSNL